MPSSRLTATNLAVHAHLQCDLYLHQSYHGVCPPSASAPEARSTGREPPAAISLAAFNSGNAWESILFAHLDRIGLLLTNWGPPLTGSDIASIIELDERPHFFVAGVSFWPPERELYEEYAMCGVKAEDVPRFGIAKPDLIEIWREDHCQYVWRVIDAKASKDVKTSHLVQTYFYYLCLKFILPSSFIAAPTTAIWLPPGLPSSINRIISPSLTTLHATPIAPLVVPLMDLIFIRLPEILSSARSEVSWHYNPLCRTCPYSSKCRARVEEEGGLGKAGEISISEAVEIRGFMKLSREAKRAITISHRYQETDIEDLVPNMGRLTTGTQGLGSELTQLAGLLADGRLMNYVETQWPASAKKVQRILGIQHRNKSRAGHSTEGSSELRSSMIEAALTNKPRFTNRRIYTLPASEDIAIYVSLIIDPSRPTSASGISEFCLSTEISTSFIIFARKHGFKPPRHIHGSTDDLVPVLSKCIRGVLNLHADMLLGEGPQSPETREHRDNKEQGDTGGLPRTQFYVWSTVERDSLQKYLVNAALGPLPGQNSGPGGQKAPEFDDIRLCIGALCEGASLLATTFQPHILEGAFLGFLGKKGKDKAEMNNITRRLGMELIPGETAEKMRQRIINEIKQLGNRGARPSQSERKTVGLLPRVVVLKKELRRLVAFPIPGWWDAKEAAETLHVTSASRCPDEGELFRRYWEGETNVLRVGIEARNDTCRDLVNVVRRSMRWLPDSPELLVNRAGVLSADWVDVCRVDALRKIFYMQQFEVLLKLQELWNTRLEGCPDAPLLLYRSTTPDTLNGGGNNENGHESTAAVTLHSFELIAGNLEVAPERDRDRAFFDYLLVEEGDESDEPGAGNHLPLEALFDDLNVSGLMFPLNRYTSNNWNDGQAAEVKDGRLWVADVRDVKIHGKSLKTQVVLRTWSGSRTKKELVPGRRYRLSPRLVDFNTTKMLSTLVELDLKAMPPDTSLTVAHARIPPFVQLISRPKSFGGPGLADSSDAKDELRIKVILDAEVSLHRLYTELRDLGNENAGALVLKASQRRAARRIFSERLTVIWGPPGSGKSYTIALSLLRMLEVQARTRTLAPGEQQIIFVTAVTHAAIQACLSKLRKIIDCYRRVPDLSLGWLDELKLEHVLTGTTHPRPAAPGIQRPHAEQSLRSGTWIYAGTVYQLYPFGKRLSQGVDCVVIDEAGQLGLCAASLVLRALSDNRGVWGGKLVVAGDREQLAPILSGQYPELGGEQRLLFGSVLDCLMGRNEWEGEDVVSTGVTTPEDKSAGTVVQLLENFRLNPDLGDFVQTIYKRAFKPQKSQARRVAIQLRRLEDETLHDMVSERGRNLFLSLSKAMLGKEQSLFDPPLKQTTSMHKTGALPLDSDGSYTDPTPTPRSISLVMLKLCLKGEAKGEIAYESHVRAEAKVAATLVRLLQKACGAETGDEGDDIFVACPHRVQRAAVNLELRRGERVRGRREQGEDGEGELRRSAGEVRAELKPKEGTPKNIFRKSIDRPQETPVPVTVDTIERLQSSEASFVICLFSHTHRGSLTTALPFLLARRRLNVAISRAKTLCIVISSDGVLRPGVGVFADRESAKGYAFLRAFEERAWNAGIDVEVEI